MTATAVAAALDDAVHARTERAYALLEQLVREPSEVGGEDGAVAVLAAELEALGFDTRVVPIPAAMDEDPAAGVPVVAYDGARGALVARLAPHRPDPGARSLLLNGHLDVVPPGNARTWAGEPYGPRREDGWLVGRGAADMKGGVAMALLAVGAFLDVLRDAMGAELTFVGAIEEECTGNGTLATVRAGVLADAVVLTEPTQLDLLAAGLGVLWTEIRIDAAGGHAETAGSVPSALDLAARLLPVLRALQPAPEHPDAARCRVNVGRIRAGDWTSSVPAEATIDVRLGFPADWSVERGEAWTRARIADAVDADPRLHADQVTVRSSGMRAAGYGLAPDSGLIAALQAAHLDVHGTRPEVVATDATTDARFYLHQGGVPAVCFGPRGRGLHAADEAVELDSIVQGARTLVRFMAAWLGADTDPKEAG